MDIISIILIGIGLAMDCFAVSTTKGLCHGRWCTQAVVMAMLFGLFQGGMPLIGYYAGNLFSHFFSQFAPWIALVLLGYLGGKMLVEGIQEERQRKAGGGEVCAMHKEWSMGNTLMLAVATSIDALATGVIFIPCPEQLWLGIGVIALMSLVFSLMGYEIGRRVGRLKVNVEVIGGVILIGIGLKICIEGLCL